MANPTSRIVVLGAGYGGITASLRLARLFRQHSEYQIHLVDRNPYHTLKTQLHEAAVRKTTVAIDIGRIIHRSGIVFHLGEVTHLDVAGKTITVDDRVITYHTIVLALGSQSNFYAIPGLHEHAFTLQSLSDAERIYRHLATMCARSASESNRERRCQFLRFVVGGGGLSGVEFAAELADHVAKCTHNYRISDDEVEILLVEAQNNILPSLDEPLRARALEKLAQKKVKVLTDTRILACSQGGVTLSPNAELKTLTVVWTGGIQVANLARKSGIPTGSIGRIVVDQYLRSVDVPSVYAIGDNALAINPTTGHPVPTAAQFALQQGRLAAENICADLFGGSRKTYNARVWGEVISLGRHLAVGWLALPFFGKARFIGFIGRLLKAAVVEKHVVLLRKESRNWRLK